LVNEISLYYDARSEIHQNSLCSSEIMCGTAFFKPCETVDDAVFV